MSKSPSSLKIKIRQVAALPYREADDGTIEIVMVTTRDTGRWILPKGWPIKGVRNAKAAESEAMEEAGLIGRAERKAFGHYVYIKRFPKRNDEVVVEVFPLRIERQLEDWPEKGQRQVRFFAPDEAAQLVSDLGVGDLIHAFAAQRQPKAPGDGGTQAAATPAAVLQASPSNRAVDR